MSDQCTVIYNGTLKPIMRNGTVLGTTDLGDVRVKYDSGRVVTVRPECVHIGMTKEWAETLLCRINLSIVQR